MNKEKSKSRSIQSELLRMVEGFADGSRSRPDSDSNEWNLVGSGDAIEDWEFTNEAIKSLLSEHYQNKGNPFTQVKIDSRSDLGAYLIEKDCAIIHTTNGHIFQRGIDQHFGDFPDSSREIVESSNSERHSIISNSGVTKHSSAEGVFLGSALFMEESRIRNFLGIPQGISTVLLPSHRRKFSGIQVEIDSMLMWVVNNHTFISIFEVKSDSKIKPDWTGGYSYHQVKNTALTVGARFSKAEKESTTIIPVYFRSEWRSKSDVWNAKLDLFESFESKDSVPRIISSLDILNLPR